MWKRSRLLVGGPWLACSSDGDSLRDLSGRWQTGPPVRSAEEEQSKCTYFVGAEKKGSDSWSDGDSLRDLTPVSRRFDSFTPTRRPLPDLGVSRFNSFTSTQRLAHLCLAGSTPSPRRAGRYRTSVSRRFNSFTSTQRLAHLCLAGSTPLPRRAGRYQTSVSRGSTPSPRQATAGAPLSRRFDSFTPTRRPLPDLCVAPVQLLHLDAAAGYVTRALQGGAGAVDVME
jgi:hypothetical protein